MLCDISDSFSVVLISIRENDRSDFIEFVYLQKIIKIIQYNFVGISDKPVRELLVYGFHIQHHPVAVFQDLTVFPEIKRSVGIK